MKTPPVLLVTVPHTGNRFFIRLLETALGPHHALRTQTEKGIPKRPYPFAAAHVEHVGLLTAYIASFPELALVTATRQMEAIYASYNKRGINDGRVERHLRRWSDFMRRYRPLVVSVDAPDREERLQKLCQLIGKKLETDWKPVP